jgi:hypothetical protein
MIDRAAPDSAASWRALADSPSASKWPISPRERAVFAYLALFLAAVGLFAGALSWYRPAPSPYFVSVWIAEYESTLIPRVPHAVQDGRAILTGGFFPRTTPTAPSQWLATDLNRALSQLAALTRADTAVVYICGISLCDADGKVGILPSDARLEQPQKWIPLGRVLDVLRQCPARGKLLILDILATPPTEATLVYPNDVAGRIDAELALVDDPRRMVLCTCSTGEISLDSDALGRSVFGIFLERGLRGEADGFGIRGRKDGRVTVRELAHYVIDQVEGWARAHRNARQLPRLVASDGALDFPLLAVRPRSSPLVPIPEPATYPNWLRYGWAWRDSLRDGNVQHDSPGIIRRLDAILLRAEGDWRGGYDPEQIKSRTADELAACRRALDVRAKSPSPPPISLAQEIAAGHTPDPKAVEPLNKALAQLEQAIQSAKPEELPAARDKIVSDLLKSLGDFDDFTLAWAVWQAAVGDARQFRLLFLQSLLDRRQPSPRYVETLWLSRIARPASVPPASTVWAWPSDVLGDLVNCVNLGETANIQPRSFAWVRSAIDSGAQARHDAEALAIDPGYAPLDQVRRALDRSRAHLNALRESQSEIESARGTIERSLATLIAVRPALDSQPGLFHSWRQTLRATERVLGELDRLRSLSGDRTAGTADLRRTVRWLVEQSAPLRESFESSAVDRLAATANSVGADGSIISTIGDMLATPLPRAEDRIKLWDALQTVSRRIDGEGQATDNETPRTPMAPPPRRSPDEIAELRRLVSMELLGLAGLTPGATPPKPRPDRNLLEAWADSTVPAWKEGDGWRGDRVERLAPLFAIDGLASSPSWRLHLKEQADIWAWLAGHYQYEFVDGGRSAVDALAAAEFRRAAQANSASSIPPVPMIELPTAIPSMNLTRAGLTARYELTFRILAAAANGGGNPDGRPTLQLFNPDESWMTIHAAPATATPTTAGKQGPGSASRSALLIVGDARDDLTIHESPPPPGFIARITTAGRSFHARVPVELPTAPTVAIKLSRSPDGPTGPLDVVHLRPIASTENFYIYAVNRTAVPRKANVEVRDGAGAVLAAAAVVTIDPMGVLRLPLTSSAGSKPTSVRGPLIVIVRDPDRPTASPIVRNFPIQLRPPWDYTEVVETQYVPADPLSGRTDRLIVQVRQSEPVDGPAPVVSLSLTADRIFGFVSAGRGTFEATLDPLGAVATLYAEGLQFRGNPPPEGTFSLDVDGYERAFLFRTNFPADGSPVTPSALNRPAIAIRAPEFAASSVGLDIRLFVDHAPDDASIDLDLFAGESPRAAIEVRKSFASPRNVNVQLIPPAPDAPAGGLALVATAGDWMVHLDTGAIEGRRKIRALVLDGSRTELATAARTVILEQRPATDVQILGVPAQAAKGKTLTATAIAAPPLSSTMGVDFFIGKSPPGGTLPADTKLISATRSGIGKTWTAPITLPDDKLGPLDVSVRFLSRAGLSAFGTTTVQVLAADPAQVGRIEGRIAEGGLPQGGLEVALLDAQGKAILKVTSRSDGTFTFAGVPIGRYRAATVRPDAGTHAQSDPFDVSIDSAASVILDLSL